MLYLLNFSNATFKLKLKICMGSLTAKTVKQINTIQIITNIILHVKSHKYFSNLPEILHRKEPYKANFNKLIILS